MVVHGNGRAFSAGFDLKAGAAARRETEADWRAAIDTDLELIMRFLAFTETDDRRSSRLRARRRF